MKKFYTENKIIVKKIVAIVLFAVFFYVFFRHLVAFFAPLIFGYLLSVVIRPLVGFYTGKVGLGRGLSTALALLTLFALLIFVSITAISRLISEGAAFYDNLPQLAFHVEVVFLQFDQLIYNVYQLLPNILREGFYTLLNAMVHSLPNMLGYGFRNFGNGFIGAVPRVAIGTVLAFISSYFFSRDRELISNTIKGLIPDNLKPKVQLIRGKLTNALWGYVKAQLIIMSIVASIGIVGHLIMGTPYALFLAVAIALVDAIPVFGSGLFYWPWMVASLITGEHVRLMGLAIIYICTLFTRQFLEPKILGNQIGIHPILTLASIYMGIMVFGFFGIFLGPVFAVVCRTILYIDNEV